MPKKANEKLIVENDIVATQKSKSKTSKASTSSTASKSTTKNSKNVKDTTINKVSSKNTSKKSTTTKKSSKKSLPIVEYYDLPNLYNQTIIKILAQTPTVLFVYWDISAEDRNAFLEKYGENFFNDTVPYLSVTNQTKNYSFEVEINDFANSWYINIADSDCKYDVVLFRKPKNNDVIHEDIYITSSNNLQFPNDHILFDSIGKTVFFKNVNTNQVEQKNTATLSFMNNVGRIYNIYDLYKEIYKDEIMNNKLDVHMSSSNMSF